MVVLPSPDWRNDGDDVIGDGAPDWRCFRDRSVQQYLPDRKQEVLQAGRHHRALVITVTEAGGAGSPQQQPGQGVQVPHVGVVIEDAVYPLLLVREDVVKLSFQLGRLCRRAL